MTGSSTAGTAIGELPAGRVLAVIGNISRDVSVYPDGRRQIVLGGAALHITLAARRARIPAAPVAVIGGDLTPILTDPRLDGLDLSAVAVVGEGSCAFTLTYDGAGALHHVDARYGAAEHLTTHALQACTSYQRFHVCCRRPLDSAAVLAALIGQGAPFTVDVMASSAAQQLTAIAAYLPRADLVFTNAAEYDILTTICDPRTLPAVAVTDGPRTARLYRRGRQSAAAHPPTVRQVEVTGAGDTFTGTLLAALYSGAPDAAALRDAVAAASAHVSVPNLTTTVSLS